MTLHLLRFDPDLARASQWFASEKLLPRNAEDGGYAWHALLAAAFGKAPPPARGWTSCSRRGPPTRSGSPAYAGMDPAPP